MKIICYGKQEMRASAFQLLSAFLLRSMNVVLSFNNMFPIYVLVIILAGNKVILDTIIYNRFEFIKQ